MSICFSPKSCCVLEVYSAAAQSTTVPNAEVVLQMENPGKVSSTEVITHTFNK